MPSFRNYLQILLIAALATGCSTLPSPPDKPQAEAREQASVPAALPPRSFKPETLYSLLVAELAGQRKRYDILLSNYLAMAENTGDAGIAERATHIASYLKARKAGLRAARLWQSADPHNAAARQALADQLVANQQPEAALDQLEQLLTEHGEASFEFMLANSRDFTAVQRNQLLEKIDDLQARHPQSSQLLLTQTLLLQLNGRNEAALAAATRLDKLEQSTRSLTLKARLKHQLGETASALRDLKTGLAKNPEDLRLRLLYAQLLIDDKQLLKAQHQFQKLAAQSPENAQYKLTLALLQLENGFTREGNRHLTELTHQPKMADNAYFYLGQSAEKQSRPDAAINYYQQVKSGPKLLPALHHLGALLLAHRDEKALTQTFLQAREAHPDHHKRLFLIETELLVDADLLSTAMQRLDTALQAYPQDINLLFTRAMVSEKNNDLITMEADLRRILAQEPDNAMALNALGYTLADRTTRYEEALALITRAKALKPDDPAITDSLGWAQFRLGNYDEAIRLLEKALADYPDHEVAAHLGEALWVTGQHQRARKIWREALERTPDSPILKKVIERLKPGLQQ